MFLGFKENIYSPTPQPMTAASQNPIKRREIPPDWMSNRLKTYIPP